MTACPSLPALTRVCRGACGLSLPLSDFALYPAAYKYPNAPRGVCRACDAARRRARYHAEPEYRQQRIASVRRSLRKHAEATRAARIVFYAANRERILRMARIYKARKRGQRDPDCQNAGGFALYENAAGRIYHLPCGLPLPRGKVAVERWAYWGEGSDDKPIWGRVK